MTVKEYREKHPDCEYCHHRVQPFFNCIALNKRMSKRTAKKCPCYVPTKWKYEDITDNRKNITDKNSNE